MKSSIPRVAGLLAALALLAAPAEASEAVPVPPAIAGLARAVAAELMMQCPLSEADDVAAFESCRTGLQGEGVLRTQLPERVLWGRQSAQGTLRKTTLTQLRPDVWTQLYAPLFMFNGNHRVEWVPQENQFAIRLEAAFRNRLPAADFPYPLWHDDAEWNAYQHANALVLWVQPQTARIHVAQFTDEAPTPLLQPVQAVTRSFDGEWLVNANARPNAGALLFDRLYRADNPYLLPLDRHYRDFALQLQQAQCGQCHVPSNPAHARRLVLLATPAHAAGEIERVIATVRSNRMADGAGHPHGLPAEDREWLLQSAEGFREVLGAARGWEQQAERNEHRVTWLPLNLVPSRTLAVSRETQQ